MDASTHQHRTRKKLTTLAAALACGVWLLAGCQSTKDSEMGGLRREMRNQMMTMRAQLRAAGASAAQLREFDKATSALTSAMEQVEQQSRLAEKQMNGK